MNQDQIIDLLKAASAYDNRKPDPASVLAWAEAARRGGWTFGGALDAIHHHYATETARIMPGHITAHMRACRMKTVGRSVDEALALSTAPRATEARRAEFIAQVRELSEKKRVK